MNKNHQTQVLNHLKQGKTLSQAEAIHHFDCYRLSAVIDRLRKQGFDIATHQEPNLNNKGTHARYGVLNMAKGFAINNSMTNHGGIIKATQQTTSQMGNLFLRAGDGHFCPKCKCWSEIVKSHDHIIMDGKAVAYVDDLLTCGAKILPKQDHVVGTSQGENYRSSSSSIEPLKNNLVQNLAETENSVTFYFKNQVTKEPIADFFYTITLPSGEQIEGHTDDEGKTALTATGIKATDVKIETLDLSKPMEKWE